MNKIKKMNSEQLLQLHREIISELIIKIQKEYDNSLYSAKLPSDKLECRICGGKYTRCAKSKHDNSNRHKQYIRDIYENINNLIYKTEH